MLDGFGCVPQAGHRPIRRREVAVQNDDEAYGEEERSEDAQQSPACPDGEQSDHCQHRSSKKGNLDIADSLQRYSDVVTG